MRGVAFICLCLILIVCAATATNDTSKGTCVDYRSVYLGLSCDPVVKWNFWKPSPEIEQSFYAGAAARMATTAPELLCAAIYPRCNGDGEPMGFCKSECGLWGGQACWRYPATYSEDCTPITPISWPNSATAFTMISPWIVVIFIILFYH